MKLIYFAWLEGEGKILWVAMCTDEYDLHVTRPVGECFQKLVSNPTYYMKI